MFFEFQGLTDYPFKYINIACTVRIAEISLNTNLTHIGRRVHTKNAQRLLLHVSTLHGCCHQGVFTAVNKIVVSKWPDLCSSTHTLAHILNFQLKHTINVF